MHHRCRQITLYTRNAVTSFTLPPKSAGRRIRFHFLNASWSRTESPVDGYVISSCWFIGNVLMFAKVPSDSMTCAFCGDELSGFGINLPHCINGVNAKATPPAPSNFKKSRLERSFL